MPYSDALADLDVEGQVVTDGGPSYYVHETGELVHNVRVPINVLFIAVDGDKKWRVHGLVCNAKSAPSPCSYYAPLPPGSWHQLYELI